MSVLEQTQKPTTTTLVNIIGPWQKQGWVQDYVVGGYHPVHLGDLIKKQNRILRNGRCGTVWLAKDEMPVCVTGLGNYVALKIAIASKDFSRPEADALTKLWFNVNTPATTHLPVLRLFDAFNLNGPNGIHNVLALELLGSNLAQFIMWNMLRLDTDDYRDAGVLRDLSR